MFRIIAHSSALLFMLCIPCSADKKGGVQVYGEEDLLVINTKFRFTTLIRLPEGEELSEVSCGDKEFWVIEGKDGILHVKPAKEGIATNVHVVSKTKVTYSFMVREISRMPKEKVALKIVLDDTDELSKLRREKSILLDRLDKAAERPGDAKNEGAKKKDTSGLHFTNPFATVIEPPVTAPKVETPPLILPVFVQPNQPPTTVVPAPAPAAKEARMVPPEEVPLVKVPVVSEASPAIEDKSDGLLHRIGRWFRQLNRRLRIY